MKLVLLSSSGRGAIRDKIVELVGKPADKINVCIIAEAHSIEPSSKRDWLITGFGEIAEDFGGDLDTFNLLALDVKEIEKRINKVDVIWCFGGNTDFLQHVFNKSGFSKLLPKLLKTKVWVGSSAGSMVLCKRPYSYKSRKDNYGVTEYLGFQNFCIRPTFMLITHRKTIFKNVSTIVVDKGFGKAFLEFWVVDVAFCKLLEPKNNLVTVKFYRNIPQYVFVVNMNRSIGRKTDVFRLFKFIRFWTCSKISLSIIGGIAFSFRCSAYLMANIQRTQ